MKTIICIMGKTFSGKTTLVNRLKKEGKLDFIVSSTTRPPRKDEQDGVAYHFKTKVPPNALALRTYTPAHELSSKKWSYWIDKEDIQKANHPVLVVDYQGFKDLRAALPNHKVVGIYLKTPLSVILSRIMNSIRNEKRLSEAIRRLASDNIAFREVEACGSIKVVECDGNSRLTLREEGMQSSPYSQCNTLPICGDR